MNQVTQADIPPGPRRVKALDGIRGIAIIWVVLHNAMDIPVAPSVGLSWLLNVVVHAGWIGVQLFFALSGYLITCGLLETQRAPRYFRNFYAKRALRILPLYYAVLLALLVIAPHLQSLPWPYELHGQASLWLFTMNWTHDAPYGFAHFWSLAVEEQFYLLWPFVVWKAPPRRLFWCCLGISAGALILRCAMVARGADPWTIYVNTACRMDALALGAAAACIVMDAEWRARLQEHGSRILAVAGILFVVGIPLTHIYDRYRPAGETVGYSILALCSAAVVAATAVSGRTGTLGGWLGWRPLCSVGKYSYAMYVFHGLLNKLIGEPWLRSHFGPVPATAVAFLYALGLIGVSYALGYCSYQLLEKHFLRLKGYFEPCGETVVS